jgi:cephalosporin hydroxylase
LEEQLEEMGSVSTGGREVNIEHALSVQGFMGVRQETLASELTYLAQLANRNRVVVEVGSWMGQSACAMASNSCTDGVIICVDTWSGTMDYRPDLLVNLDVLNQFLTNVSRYPNVLPLRLASIDAARILQLIGVRVDAVFIDGDHSYDAVRADILAWRNLLRGPQSILCGHDFGVEICPGVEQAVRELVSDFKVIPNTTIWTTEMEKS